MKKISAAVLISLILTLLTGASDWEGSASAAVDGELPNGFFAATNSFPRHTVIEVTNLENGLTVKAVVSQGLETPGLLVMLSRDAADAIGLASRSLGRVLMSQSSEPLIEAAEAAGFNSRSLGRVLMNQSPEPLIGQLNENGFTFGDPDHDSAASVRINGGLDPALRREMELDYAPNPAPAAEPDVWTAPPPSYTPAYTPIPEPVPQYDNHDFYVVPAEPRIPVSPEPYIDPKDVLLPLDQYPKDYYPRNLFPDTADSVAAVPPPAPPVEWYPGEVYSSYPDPYNVIPSPPAETQVRRPERDYAIDPAYIIPPVRQNDPAPSQTPRSAIVIPPARDTSSEMNFSVPVISNLEKGRYYIQVTAGAEADGIESEIRKIGHSYPLAVQPLLTAGRPLYRLLIGPVNLGESGALLERFKTSYKDAFVRVGS